MKTFSLINQNFKIYISIITKIANITGKQPKTSSLLLSKQQMISYFPWKHFTLKNLLQQNKQNHKMETNEVAPRLLEEQQKTRAN